MAKKIGIILAADGEAEFTKALKNARNETSVLKSELTKLSAEYDGNANSLEALQKKQEALEKQTEAFEKSVKSAKDGLANAQTVQKKAADRYEELKKALDEARKAQEEMKAAGKEGTSEYTKQSKEVELYSKKLADQGKQCESCEGKVQSWTKKVNAAETDLIKANNALQQNEKYLKEAENATDSCATSIDEYGKSVTNATSVTTSWGEKIASAFTGELVSEGVDLLKEGVKAVIETAEDASEAAATLAASTGATTEEAERYEKVMKQIKGDNFGESYTEVANVLSQVVQTMGSLNDTDLTWITEAAMTLDDTFGIDVNESIRAVNVMMQSMGVTATEAFDLIAKGAQNGLNRSDELADNLTEYGQIWGQAGFSAEEAFAIMENGLNAGAYNLDKVNDFVKEFSISLSDGRIEDNIDSFSSGTKSLFEEWKKGNASTADVFYSVISDLENMTSEQEALTVASETWSSLGEDNAMDVLVALNDVNDAYKDVQGTMDDLADVKYSDLGNAVDQLGASIQEHLVAPLADVAIPALTALANGAADAIDGIADAVTPVKNEMEELAEDVTAANTSLANTMAISQVTMDEATEKANTIESLGTRLMELNSEETLSLTQKAELRGLVEQLSDVMPGLSDAYDTQTGSLKLTNAELETMIANTKEQIVQTALAASTQSLMNELVSAQVQKSQSDELVKNAEAEVAALKLKKEEAESLAADFTAASLAWTDASINGTQEEVDAAQAQIDALVQIAENMGVPIAELSAYITDLDGQISDAEGTLADYTAENEELGTAIEEGKQQYQDMTDAAEELFGVTADQTEATDDQTAATEDQTAATEDATAATEDLTEATEENEESTKKSSSTFKTAIEIMAEYNQRMKEAAEDGAAAQKAATDSIQEAYESTAESIKNALSFDPWSSFEGGEDQTVETMVANMQEQLDGIQKMKDNMSYVISTMGDDLSPEVVAALEQMGTDAASTWDHLAITLRGQGEEVGSEGYELVKQFSELWLEGLDVQDDLGDTMAANVTAIQDAMGELGSTDADFSELTDAIEDALSSTDWSKVTVGQEEALRDAVDIAKNVGIEIPEGLAEGIASGDVTYESALAQINGAIEGKLNGLVAVAQTVGIDVPSAITAGIEEGGPAAEAAYAALIELLSGYEQSAAAEASTVGEAAASGYNEALSAGTDGASAAGSAVGSAGSGGMESAESEYKSAGSSAASEYTAGIMSGTTSAQSAGMSLGKAALTGVNTQAGSFRGVGQQIAAGVAQGIADGSANVYNTAVNMAAQTLAKTKQALGIHSPSKEFQEQVGAQIAAGTAQGISEGTSNAVAAASEMGKQTVLAASEWADKYNEQISKAFNVSSTETDSDGNVTAKDAEDYYSETYSAAKNYLSNMEVLHDLSAQDELSYWVTVASTLQEGTQAWYDALEQIQSARSKAAEEQKSTYDDIVDKTETYLDHKEALVGEDLNRELEYWRSAKKQIEDQGGKYTDAWYEVVKKIKSVKKELKSAETDIYDDIVDKTEKYLEHKEILVGEDLDRELEYWRKAKKQIESQGGKYTDAWYTVVKKIKSIKKESASDTKDVYEEILSAASDYVSKREATNAMSLKQEQAYWKSILSTVKKGTDAWYTAKKNLNSASSNIGTVSNMSTLLSTYKTYYNLSSKAEMQYWDTVRKQYKAGTDERLEADQKYLDAKENYYEELESLDKDYLDSVQDVNDKLKDDIESLTETYESNLKSRTKEIANAFSIFEEFTSSSESGQTLLFNMQSQAAGYEDWSKILDTLGKRGILSDDLMKELTDQGPAISAQLYALNSLTDEELTAYNEAYQKKMDAAAAQAKKEAEDDKKELDAQTKALKEQAAKDIAELKKAYDENVAKINTGISSELKALAKEAKSIAEDQTTALIAGLKGQDAVSGTASSTGSSVKDSTLDAVGAARNGNGTTSKGDTSDATQAGKKTAESQGGGTDKILQIINSGEDLKTLTDAQRKAHSLLYRYLVDNYGKKGTDSMYKKLADALGIKADAVPTVAQRKSILAALKAKGYRSGGRVSGDWIWMDEELESTGPEMIVRSADNAILTRVQPGDEIINASTAANLTAWGDYTPESFAAALEARSALQQTAAAEAMAALAGAGSLNSLTGISASGSTVSLGRLEDMLSSVMSTLGEFLPYLAQRQQIVMNTGELVGATVGQMSNALAMRSRRTR